MATFFEKLLKTRNLGESAHLGGSRLGVARANEGSFAIFFSEPGQQSWRVSGCEDLGSGPLGLRSHQFEQEPQTTGMQALFDLLNDKDFWHRRLEEGGGKGDEAAGAFGDYGTAEFPIALFDGHHEVVVQSFKGVNIVHLIGADFFEP